MGEQSPNYALIRDQIAQARAAERESCAKLAAQVMDHRFGMAETGKTLAGIIRGMGQ